VLTRELLQQVIAQVPDDWLQGPDAWSDAQTQREAYLQWLCTRLEQRSVWLTEAVRARA
jgi:hypothetical protein